MRFANTAWATKEYSVWLNTVKVLINATLFNNYVFKSRVSLEVEKLSYRPGVALLEGRILIGGIFGTWCACGRALSFKGQVSAAV